MQKPLLAHLPIFMVLICMILTKKEVKGRTELTQMEILIILMSQNQNQHLLRHKLPHALCSAI